MPRLYYAIFPELYPKMDMDKGQKPPCVWGSRSVRVISDICNLLVDKGIVSTYWVRFKEYEEDVSDLDTWFNALYDADASADLIRQSGWMAL
jgi:hypothetical protein